MPAIFDAIVKWSTPFSDGSYFGKMRISVYGLPSTVHWLRLLAAILVPSYRLVDECADLPSSVRLHWPEDVQRWDCDGDYEDFHG